MAKLINVSNRLPLTIGTKITKSGGGLVSALDAVRRDTKMLWLGWPGKNISGKTRQNEIEQLLAEQHGCVPVFLANDEINGYYHGFSNSTLWPLFHYRSHYIRHNASWWQYYQQVNQKFADAILRIAKGGDLVWIHDYHLMLVPQLLRKSRKKLKVGFFLHTPFPSYEVFRCHPQRRQLLAGLTGSDLIGFHTFGYMRHFRSSAMRILGTECENTIITQHDRSSHLGVFPIGADVDAFTQEMQTVRFKKQLKKLQKIYAGKKIVLSVERLDYSKGIVRRLEAINRFLSKYPDRNKIVFIFIAVPSRGEVPEYIRLRKEVQSLVGQLNGKHSTVENIPLHFINKSVGFTELCALYRIADAAMVTPLIDGMNLVAKEYVACHSDATGVLLLSEFTGAADELFQAFLVNPYDIDQMADTLKLALLITPQDVAKRMGGMYHRISQFDAKYWAKSFVDSLSAIEMSPAKRHKKLNVSAELRTKLRTSDRIAFFLDYDGTLKSFQNEPEKARPTAEIEKLLKVLNGKKSIDTYIISGRNGSQLSQWFGKYDFTLIAEHGFSYCKAGSGNWRDFGKNVDLSWKGSTRSLFKQYSGTTPGSFVEEKASAIVWHYRRSDPEFGKMKADQLVAMLQELLVNMPAEVHHGKKIVEVSSMQVNKGIAMATFIKGSKYDFVLCAGDDQTDETMFRLDDERLFKIKVGTGATSANYRVSDCNAFIDLLVKSARLVK